VWYPDDVVWYLFSRAYDHGVRCLAPMAEVAERDARERRQPDGSFGSAMSTAVAISTLLNFGVPAHSLEVSVAFLVDQQAKDGSWPRAAFYFGDTYRSVTTLHMFGSERDLPSPSDPRYYFGSEELTTALCLEALARYQRSCE
jgi:hypothetical protein